MTVGAQTGPDDMTMNIKAMLFAIAVLGTSACFDESPGGDVQEESLDDGSSLPDGVSVQGDEPIERLTADLDPERAAAEEKARMALIGTGTITPSAAACGTGANTTLGVRVVDAAVGGAARQRTGSSTGCAAPGQLETTDDATYYCFTCTTHCDDIGSWTYNRNVRTNVFGWTRNDLLKPEPGSTIRGASRFCGF